MNDLEEEVLPGYPDETFVTYRNCRIFYKFKDQHNEWFSIVHLTGKEAAQPEYSTLGCNWFASKRGAIDWGKKLVDNYRDK